MELDYCNDIFTLQVYQDHEMFYDIYSSFKDNKIGVHKHSLNEGCLEVEWPDTYLSAWDIRLSDWYEEARVKLNAKDRLLYWGNSRLQRETVQPTIDNSDDWFGYQWQTARICDPQNGGPGHVFINDGTGLGKTRSALACLESNFRSGPNIIVCPKVAIPVWKKEIEAVYPGCDYISIVGDAKERKLRLKHVEDVNFVIISYDALIKHSSCQHWPNSKSLPMGEFDAYKWNAVIVDESHRIKNPQALRTRCCWQLSRNANIRIALTATPITATPQDLWAQWKFLSPEEFSTLARWRERFLNMEKNYHGGYDCIGWSELGRTHYLQLCGWRTTRNQFSDKNVAYAMQNMTIPEEGPHTVVHVPLHKVQQKAYRQMLELYIAIWKDNPVIAKNDLEKFMRLRQISNGMPVTTDDGKVIGLDSPSSKADMLCEIIDDADCNVVVFCEHSKVAGLMHRQVEDYRSNSSYTTMIITGETRQETRQHYIKAFQDTSCLRKKILICTTGTMSESISLTNAGLLIFAQEPASMQQFVQCRGRVRRIGSVNVVPAISLRGQHTVEDHLALRMDKKLDFLNDYMESITAKVLQNDL